MQKKISGMGDFKSFDFLKKKTIFFLRHKSQFDWYLEYKELKIYFEQVFPLKKTDKILMVGCGNASKISGF